MLFPISSHPIELIGEREEARRVALRGLEGVCPDPALPQGEEVAPTEDREHTRAL